MKKAKIIMLMLALICGIGAVHADKGQNAVGFNLGYAAGGNGVNNFGIGVKYDYSLSDNLRVEPSINYYFATDKLAQQDGNVNFHYLFNLDTEEKFHLYPIFGFTALFGKEREVGDNFFRLGCNLGMGFQYDITDDFGLVVEGKYKLVKSFSQANFAVGCVVQF